MRADPFEDHQRIPDIAARRFFTDREDLIQAFQLALAAPADRPMQALVFYGVGGVGKTSLLHQLREGLPAALPYAFVDLGNVGDKTRAYREVLLKLRFDLGTNFKVDFPRFDLALAVLLAREGDATGKAPPLDMFAGIPEPHLARDLAKRFLTSLHSSGMQAWVIDLSLTPRFDQDAALALAEARRHAVGLAEWKRLRHFSFLEPQPDGFYRLHATMHAALRAHIEPDDARAVHQWFATYWSGRAQPSLAWFHRWTLDPTDALLEWKAQHDAALKQLRIRDARQLLSRWSDVPLGEAERQALGDELWALTHHHLGSALLGTPFAPRRDPLPAIEHLQLSLLVYTQASSPRRWAGTQNDLGNAYEQLPTGDRGENLRRAIACLEAALQVYREAELPAQWVPCGCIRKPTSRGTGR